MPAAVQSALVTPNGYPGRSSTLGCRVPSAMTTAPSLRITICTRHLVSIISKASIARHVLFDLLPFHETQRAEDDELAERLKNFIMHLRQRDPQFATQDAMDEALAQGLFSTAAKVSGTPRFLLSD